MPRADSTSSAINAGVGFSNISAKGNSISKVRRMRAVRRDASREFPPHSKKLSSGDGRRPSSSSQRSAIVSSTGPRNAVSRVSAHPNAASSILDRAARSILPFEVSGSRSITRSEEGTM